SVVRTTWYRAVRVPVNHQTGTYCPYRAVQGATSALLPWNSGEIKKTDRLPDPASCNCRLSSNTADPASSASTQRCAAAAAAAAAGRLAEGRHNSKKEVEEEGERGRNLENSCAPKKKTAPSNGSAVGRICSETSNPSSSHPPSSPHRHHQQQQ
ncbi:hypothetical protein BHM03_00062092, partial [Ensete ventricosum]